MRLRGLGSVGGARLGPCDDWVDDEQQVSAKREDGASGQHERPLDEILEFAHVAGPRIRQQPIQAHRLGDGMKEGIAVQIRDDGVVDFEEVR
jgi:hypothetical protein